ncbi:MAG: hypothetical protein JSW51_01110 [Gemmatimonadota bacterium]|nr:MAG: hypothetical protein JSW51_01110 [Gemmatimonadota bacterium]
MSQDKEKPGSERAEAKSGEVEQRNHEPEATHKPKPQSKHADLGNRLREVLEVRILN